MDEFEVMATAMCRQTGIDIGIEDLVLVRLMYDAAFGQVDAVDTVDPGQLSAGPIDAGGAPGLPRPIPGT
jgi:hypothetical protein